MAIQETSDLNGHYQVVYQTQAPQIPGFPWYDHTQGSIAIIDGKLRGTDIGGATWYGDINLNANNDEIEFVVNVDPNSAPAGTFLLDIQGRPCRIEQTYSGNLKILKIGENLTIYGTVIHGCVSIEITMKRIQHGT